MATILIVDDEEDEREIICSWVTESGHKVYDAASGEAGLSIIGRMHIDLVVVDILMPGMGGMSVINRLKESVPGAAFIAMSGYLQEDTVEEVTRAGGLTIEKPFAREDFQALISRALAESKMITERSRV